MNTKPHGIRVFSRRMMVNSLYVSKDAPPREMDVHLEIDVDSLMRWLAPRARWNKSHRTYIGGGDVKLTVKLAGD